MLDPEQAAAVESTAERLAVIAGAGTGKTRVLTHRAARICEATPPHRVLCVTFTRKAAREMKERLEAMGGYLPEVRTLHAWAASFIREHADRVGRSPGFAVYDDVDALSLLRMCARENSDKRWENAKRSTLMKVDEHRDLYQRRLREADAVDFDDLEVYAERLLKEGAGVDRYDHVLVDEAQDLSPIQANMLAWLNPPNLCMVGDPRQSIYRFRGSAPEIFQRYVDNDRTQVITLRRNYRSRQPIVDTANNVAPPRWGTMDAHRSITEADVELAHLDRSVRVERYVVGSQPAWIAASIEHRVREQGIDPGDIAVLARAWWEVEEVHQRLRGSVPAVFYGAAEDPWREPWARMLARALSMVGRPGGDDNLVAMIFGWGRDRFDASRVADLRAIATAERLTLLEAAARVSPAMRNLWGVLAADPDEADTAEIGEAICRSVLGKVPAPLQRLLDEQRGTSVASWRDWWLFGRQEHGQESKRGDGVHLLTVHAAKGLEWPVVYGMSVADGVFPGRGDEQEQREARRLLYVMVTRARDNLILTRPESIRGRAVGWSPFLDKVG